MSAQGIALASLLGPKHRQPNLTAATPDRVIEDLLRALDETEGFPDGAIETMKRAILAREKEGSTGIGHGIAIPHMKNCPFVSTVQAMFGRAPDGVDFSATDGAPVHLFFLLLIPVGQESEHVRLMRKVVTLSRDRVTLNYLRTTDNFDNFQGILKDIDDQFA